MKLPKIFMPKKDYSKDKIKKLLLLKEEIKQYTKFKVIHFDNYAEGIAKLKEQKKKPFTFSENVEARIIDYEENIEDARLFRSWLNSVTGVAYKSKSTKFKLILRSDKLENIVKGFNQSFIPIDYSTEKGIEFDRKKGKYDQLLTREEVKNHEFWIAIMNGDKEKLARYVDIWFDEIGKREKGMGVYLGYNIEEDELWALTLGDGDDVSDAGADYGFYGCLDGDARFASGA